MVGFENHIGRISLSENFITELVRHAVCDCFGVADVCSVNTFRNAVSSLTHGKLFRRKGVVVHADKNGGITVNLHIKVTYGTNISAAVESITHKIIFTLEETADIKVNAVNVYVDEMNN
ncbi:MAG: Asp23/Gls24 family envelope stress response protein [Ruminococcus sp.]|nr:Asp23/Gls24 family envelope stress response protein [Ruminococcus sp.]MDE7226226.1 Asp23/Gls24 family envelope stress response protein [Ruminococcus sp.]